MPETRKQPIDQTSSSTAAATIVEFSHQEKVSPTARDSAGARPTTTPFAV